MLIDRWQEIESLYHSARERNPEERLAYLESACGGDETLLHEVESLLANDDLAAEFLETDHEAPAGTPGAAIPPGERIGSYVDAAGVMHGFLLTRTRHHGSDGEDDREKSSHPPCRESNCDVE